MLQEFITSTLPAAAPDLASGSDAERRPALIGADPPGVAFGRRVLAVGPLAKSSVDELVDLVAPKIRSVQTSDRLRRRRHVQSYSRRGENRRSGRSRNRDGDHRAARRLRR